MLDINKVQKTTLDLLKQNGVTPELGAQYSIRCQYAQVENVVHEAMEKHTRDFIYFLQASDKFTEWEVEKIKAGFIDYTFVPK